MKPTGPNTPTIRPVISRGYINALLERSRVVMEQAEAVLSQAEEWEREQGRRPSGGRVVPLNEWREKQTEK